MAKRFTDTNKYKKPFHRGLQGAYKLLWDYLYHDCDHAGIWIVGFDIAQMYLGDDMLVDKDEALLLFNKGEKRIIEVSDTKWFIPSFVEFQYKILNPKNKAHKSVIDILEKYDLLNHPLIKIKGLASGLQGVKDKDKELVKDKAFLIIHNEKIPNETLEFLESGSIQPQEFFKNYPCPELDDSSEEIVKRIIISKNPNSLLKPDDYQLSIIKKFLFLNPSKKDILTKSIDGAIAGDKLNNNSFDVPKLTADYITNPKNQSRLIGYWDVEQSINQKGEKLQTETNDQRKDREQKEDEVFKNLPTKERVNFLVKGNNFSMFSQLKRIRSETEINNLIDKLTAAASSSDDLSTCALSFSQIITESHQELLNE